MTKPLLLAFLLALSAVRPFASGDAVHWSFQPLRNPTPPPAQSSSWPRDPIDSFILAALQAHGLEPAPEATRLTWLRRVTFDLTGLPPTPDETAAFLADTTPAAFETVVDRLLGSPHYGERWAQHWLDVVRYADTHGFEVNTERPNAWPYRDYVIRAFNRDTPYDQFVREQIIGDQLSEDAATGFLITASVLLPGQIGADEPSKRLARQDALDEIVVNISQTFLGLSVGCARCHNHKFDPISQRDYYSMQAFVAGVEYDDREMHTTQAERLRLAETEARRQLATVEHALADLVPIANSGITRPPVNARMNVDRIAPAKAKRLRFTIRQTNSLEPCIDELEVFDPSGTNIALASAGTIVTSSGDNVAPDRHELRFINDAQYGNSRSWMSSQPGQGWVILEFPEEHTVDRIVWGRDRTGEFSDRLATNYLIEIAAHNAEWCKVSDSSDRADKADEKAFLASLSPAQAHHATQLLERKKELERNIRSSVDGRLAFAGKFRAPDKIHVLTRGDPEQPRDLVQPAVLRVLAERTLPPETTDAERRAALADWIASAENPLTARVMVNRIWQGHFGTGLVATPSDFGKTGSPPSHPELLDWLATEFIRSGWSIKHLHRRIVLSATYRQSSRLDPAAHAQDSDVRWLWRYPSRRLEAEAIRDAMLAVSGTMNPRMYGRGFDLFDKRGGLSGFKPVESFGPDGLRRLVYAHKIRREREAVFGAFDCPDAGQSTARRRESTTPIQALNLLNSRFTLDAAHAFASRVRTDAGEDRRKQINHSYRLALGRPPAPDELAELEPIVREHGLVTLCRALFNSNEFVSLP